MYNIVAKNSANLWRRIFKVDSMAVDLNRYLLSVFLRDGAVYPNTFYYIYMFIGSSIKYIHDSIYT